MLFAKKAAVEDFETAALPHLNDLYRAATRMLGDPGKAEDVVQDVYLLAWKSFDRYEPGTNCRAWLFKILFNSIHHYRRKWLNLRFIADGDDVVGTMPAAPAIPEHFTDEEILRALDGLSTDYRSVVLLADVEEFSYKEVASILNVPIGTVMSRLSRARRLLREKLAGIAQSYGVGNASTKERSA